MFDKKNHRTKTLVVGLLASLFVLGMASAYTFSTQIHGDGQYHEIIARQVLEEGWPLKENKLFVMSFAEDGSPRYSPINYPQTVYLLYGWLLKIGPTVLQFSSPLFATLTALLLFLLLRPFGLRIAALGAAAAVIFNLRRFIISPIIEQPLLAALAATLLLFVLWLENGRARYAIATGVFAGIAMSLKQQGLLIGPIIVVVTMTVLFLPRFAGTRRRYILTTVGILALAVVITVPFQLEHFSRNGTIGYVPGAGTSGILDRIPLVENIIENKYPGDATATAVIAERLGYGTSYRSPFDTVAAYLAFPFRYGADVTLTTETILFILLVTILVGIGIWRTFVTNAVRAVVLVSTLALEVVFTHLTQSSIWQYHVLGLAILGIFVAAGLVSVPILIGRSQRLLLLTPLIVAMVIFVFMQSFINYLHRPNFGNSGRQDPGSLQAYEEMGAYIDSHLPMDEIILAGGTNLVKYSGRKRFWISNGGGARIPEIYNSTDVNRSHQLLQLYPIKYLLIDERQMEKAGLYDSIEITGLNQTIESERGRQLFTLAYIVYRASGQALRLYEIN